MVGSAHPTPYPLPFTLYPLPPIPYPLIMWRITINCSADDWRISGTAFKDLAAKYPTTLLSSKKMHGDERRIMEYQIENVSDAEDFTEECMTIAGFTAIFESL
jgi:hypothetical protein